MVTKLDDAIQFAVEVFEGQRRDDKFTPAVMHSMETLVNLTTIGRVFDEDLACAAVLHDVVEDCNVTPEELVEQFGYKVTELVMQLTMREKLSYEDKTKFMVRLMKMAQPEVVLLKLCDRLSNVSDMSGWKAERIARYVRQTQAMLEALGEREIIHEKMPAELLDGITSLRLALMAEVRE